MPSSSSRIISPWACSFILWKISSLQPRSELLRGHPPCWEIDNSPSSSTTRSSLRIVMHARAYVKVAHQFAISVELNGLLIFQKRQFRFAWEIFFVKEITHQQSRDFPYLMQSHAHSPTGVKKVPVVGQYNSKMA